MAKRKTEPGKPEKAKKAGKAEKASDAVTPEKSRASDEAERRRAVFEKERDVVVHAGAGTGKTTLLVRRLVELVAPEGDEPAIPLGRLAAITFTRRAAGELKNRIREELLELSASHAPEKRRTLAKRALEDLDQAWIGTIHSFCDRLLRLCPVEAGISPRYEILEDTDGLIDEVLARWGRGAWSREPAAGLKRQWSDPALAPDDRALELAGRWFRELRCAGIPARGWSTHGRWTYGIRELVVAWARLRGRGHCRELSEVLETDWAKDCGALARQIEKTLAGVRGGSKGEPPGVLWFRQALETLRQIGSPDSADKRRAEGGGRAKAARRAPEAPIPWRERAAGVAGMASGTDLQLRRDFGDHPAASGLWALKKEVFAKGGAFEKLEALVARELFAAAPRVEPTILSLLDDVKRRRERVELHDLLVKLARVLKTNEGVRSRLASLLDHVFVDEFQDTDPVQAEILLALCRKVGTLTLVGDPKQSIYRFRGADLRVYQKTVSYLVEERRALVATLSVNYRSRPELIESFNDAFAASFEDSSEVKYGELRASAEIPSAKGPVVLALRVADEIERDGEARVLVRHLVWWLGKSDAKIRDPGDGSLRSVRLGDVAILARATSHLGGLLRELRRAGLGARIAGGELFSESPAVRSFVLALSAIANPDDGPARAALFDVPASSVPIVEAAYLEATPARRELEEWIAKLRKLRASRPPLETALELIESSLFLPYFGLAPGGEEDLAILYRAAHAFADLAEREGLSFDEAARFARGWLEGTSVAPPMDGNADSVLVSTIHQSKGLEFPVVFLFDGFDVAKWLGPGAALLRDNDGSWAISLGDWKVPMTGRDLIAADESAHGEEIRRVEYVASTRARDFLVVPVPESNAIKRIWTRLWGGTLANVDFPVVSGAEASAIHLATVPEREPWIETSGVLDESVSPALVAVERAVPRIEEDRPTQIAHGGFSLGGLSPEESEPRWVEVEGASRGEGKGAEFGTAVHRAIELHLVAGISPADAAARACSEVRSGGGGVTDASAVTARVEKALDLLRTEGVLGEGWSLRSEVPFAVRLEVSAPDSASGAGLKLVRGVIDLLAIRGGEARIYDFKTDAEISPALRSQYETQLQVYGRAFSVAYPELCVKVAGMRV